MLVALQTQQTNPVVVLAVVVALLVFGSMALANRLAVYRSFGDAEDAVAPESMTNCPSCGTRLSEGDETCDHCGDPVPASE